MEESFFYIVSPRDIVVAKPCDLDDHIAWLHSKGRFEEAVKAAEGRERDLKTHNMLVSSLFATLVSLTFFFFARDSSHCHSPCLFPPFPSFPLFL